MKTLGKKIYELRRKQGLSQEQLGYEIDVSRQTVSKWESDAMLPTTDNIMSLCEYFNVTTEYLLDNDETASTGVDALTSTSAIVEKPLAKIDKTGDTLVKKSYPKKLIILFSVLISFFSIVFIAGVIIGAVALSILVMPSIGMDEHHILSADTIVIVCGVLSSIALLAIVFFVVLLKRNKNRQK